MCHNQLFKRTKNKPVNLHSRDICMILSFCDPLVREVVNWRCHTVCFPIRAFSSRVRSQFHMFHAWMLVSGYLPPHACLSFFTSNWQLQYSKKEQPLKGDHQVLVVMSSSKSTWARLEYACAKKFLPRVTCHSFHVHHAPKNSRRKLSWHCTNLRNSLKFSPSNVSHFMVYDYLHADTRYTWTWWLNLQGYWRLNMADLDPTLP